jgi:hypothetical protein
MPIFACCSECERTTRCHNLIEAAGRYPICGPCLVVLVADVEREGSSISLIVTYPAEVAR